MKWQAGLLQARLSGVCRRTLPNQLECCESSVNGYRWSSQNEPLAFKLDAANQIRINPILNDGDFDVMDYSLIAESVAPGIGNKCSESLACSSTGAERESVDERRF